MADSKGLLSPERWDFTLFYQCVPFPSLGTTKSSSKLVYYGASDESRRGDGTGLRGPGPATGELEEDDGRGDGHGASPLSPYECLFPRELPPIGPGQVQPEQGGGREIAKGRRLEGRLWIECLQMACNRLGINQIINFHNVTDPELMLMANADPAYFQEPLGNLEIEKAVDAIDIQNWGWVISLVAFSQPLFRICAYRQQRNGYVGVA